METLALYFKLVAECIEAMEEMSAREFNTEQCEYLVAKLQVVVERAKLFSVEPCAKCNRIGSTEDEGRFVEILQLVLALAKETESFIRGCSGDRWIQAAMTLTNVSEYVASIGFNLELCRIAFCCKECAPTGGLTLDQVADMHNDEVEVVKKKASVDWDTLVAKVIRSLTDKSLGSEEKDLAAHLLQRLHRIKAIPLSASSDSSWRSIIDDEGSVLGSLYKWVKPLERLGKGATGTVYKAMWLGTPVAKKTFKGRDNADFEREVEILARLCHPNITSMFCSVQHKYSCSIIMELMDEDLHNLMERRCESDENSDDPPFTLLEGIDIMLQVGEGVNYLHNQLSPSIVHRDLKSSNILVKHVKGMESKIGFVQAKVTDFGLSKTKDCSTRYSQQTVNMGTNKWMAPEIIHFNGGNEASTSRNDEVPRYPHKCDVYSFAMCCYEILVGHEPFPNESPNLVKKKVMMGERPKLPDYCPPKLQALIMECWNQDPKKRPSFDIICLELKYLKYLLITGFEDQTRPDKVIIPAMIGSFYGTVAHEFEGVDEAELTFAIGDEVLVRQVTPSGWSEGSCNGRSGWFPSTYVEKKQTYIERKQHRRRRNAIEELHLSTDKLLQVAIADTILQAPAVGVPDAAKVGPASVHAAPTHAAPTAPERPNVESLDLATQMSSGGNENQTRASDEVPSPAETQSFFAIVTRDFEGEDEGELSLTNGDEVLVREFTSFGWSEGSCNGQSGWFPSAYVKKKHVAEVEPPSPHAAAMAERKPYAESSALVPQMSSGDNENQMRASNEVPDPAPFFAIVTCDFEGRDEGELSFSIGDEVHVRQVTPSGWSEGACNGQSGWFPSTYVEKIPHGKSRRQVTEFEDIKTELLQPPTLDDLIRMFSTKGK